MAVAVKIVSATTAPPASASPTASLIAVTVCTEPVGGCNYVGASQYMEITPKEITPKEITTSGDGSAYVDNLVWSGWGGSEATATGTLKLDNCTPNCAQGTYTGYPATVTLAGPTPYGSHLEAYSTIAVQSPAANTTYTYTRDTVP